MSAIDQGFKERLVNCPKVLKGPKAVIFFGLWEEEKGTTIQFNSILIPTGADRSLVHFAALLLVLGQPYSTFRFLHNITTDLVSAIQLLIEAALQLSDIPRITDTEKLKG